MQKSQEEAEGQDFKRRRHYQTIKIRKENRNTIFCTKRTYFGRHRQAAYPSPTKTQTHEETDRQTIMYEKGVQASNQTGPNSLQESKRKKVKIMNLQQRAEEIYGPRPIPSREWQIQEESSRNIVLDQQLSDFLLDIMSYRYTQKDLDQAIESVQCVDDVLSIHRGIIIIRKIVSSNKSDTEAAILKIIDNGLLTVFTNMLQQNVFKHLQLEALWILTNIAASKHEYCERVVQRGGIELFLRVLKQGEEFLIDQAIWGLGNIAADDHQFKQTILQLNGLHEIIRVGMNTSKKSIFQNCIWAAINLCSEAKQALLKNEIKQSVQFVSTALQAGFLYENDCFAQSINMLAQFSNAHLDIIAETGVVSCLIEIGLGESYLNQQIQLGIAKIVSKFTERDECFTQILLNHRILQLIHKWLLREGEDLIDLTLFILSNIAAGRTEQVQLIFQHGELFPICRWLLQSGSQRIRNQACFVFYNISCLGNRDRVFQCYRQNKVLQLALNILMEEDSKAFLIISALRLLFVLLGQGEKQKAKFEDRNIFKEEILVENNFLEKLFQLQNKQEKQVYALVTTVLQQYFLEFSSKDTYENSLY